MNHLDPLERLMADVATEAAGPTRAVDVVAVVRSATTDSRTRRFQTMFSVAKFAVAGALVALLGGFLLTAFMTQGELTQSGPGASSSASAEMEADLLPGVALETEVVSPGLVRVISDGGRELRSLMDVEVGADGSVWVLRGGEVLRLGDQEPLLEIGPGELGTTPLGDIYVRDWFGGGPEYRVLEDGSWVPLADAFVPCADEFRRDDGNGECLVVDPKAMPAVRLPQELQLLHSAADEAGRLWLVASGPSSSPAEFLQPDGAGVEYAYQAGELYVVTPEATQATE